MTYTQLITERQRLLIVLADERAGNQPDKAARIKQYQSQLAVVNGKLQARGWQNGGVA
ncbi:MAG: hypothetical protein ACPG7F_04845 [Aggregatilineales bacterium]